MNKIIKSRIFAFIFGALIFSGITGVAAYNMLAKDIKYTPKDTTWKKSNGEDITNVEEAIDELMVVKNNSKKVLLWSNPNPTQAYSDGEITLSHPLTNYNYFMVEYNDFYLVNQAKIFKDIFEVNPLRTKSNINGKGSYTIGTKHGNPDYSYGRNIFVNENDTTKLIIEKAKGLQWQPDDGANFAIPINIYGLNIDIE